MPSFRSNQRQHKVDYLGAAVLLLTVAPLLLGFSWGGQQYEWNSVQVVGLFICSGVMLLVFVFIETRMPEPILPLSLFRNAIFVITVATFFLVGLGMFGALTYLPLFIQAVGHQSATSSGLVLVPMSVASFITGVMGGQAMTRWGRYRLLVLFSTALSTLGMFLLSRMGVETTNSTVIVNMVVLGMGMGMIFPILPIVAQNALPHSMAGVTHSSQAFFRNLGGTIGVAVMGTVVANRFTSGLQANLSRQAATALEKVRTELLASPQALLDPRTVTDIEVALMDAGGAAVTQQVLAGMRFSLATALGNAFLFAAIALGLAFFVCLFLKEIPLRKSNLTDVDTKDLKYT